jgi:hypothetical protein
MRKIRFDAPLGASPRPPSHDLAQLTPAQTAKRSCEKESKYCC